MSGNFRSRRPASPPLTAPSSQPASTPRFPPKHEDFSDADERVTQARRDPRGHAPPRKQQPIGGLKLTGGEFKVLIVICLVASAVRLYKLSKPNSVVYVIYAFLVTADSRLTFQPTTALMKCILESLLENISKRSTSWTCILP